jgi:DNA repair protein RadA/Sms
LGLSGAIRPVAQAQARLKEAAKLGFAKAVSPAPRAEKGERLPLPTQAVGHITDLVAGIAAERPQRRPVAARREG